MEKKQQQQRQQHVTKIHWWFIVRVVQWMQSVLIEQRQIVLIGSIDGWENLPISIFSMQEREDSVGIYTDKTFNAESIAQNEKTSLNGD